ncbi:MAG: hypothetical protein D6767_06215 [Candidatus Hydrogenedentota bacterium]|nr:MAG: hypothetical protein D6767_06215 [Candidatus Hydrogenedentota bacterium]
MRIKVFLTLVLISISLVSSCGPNQPIPWTKEDSKQVLKEFTTIRLYAQFESEVPKNIEIFYKIAQERNIPLPTLLQNLKKDYPKIYQSLLGKQNL